MTNHDYDTWNYWLAYYTDDKMGGYAMARTPQVVNMIDMMKHFVAKQPSMNFKPTKMYLARAVDSKQGRQWYDDSNYSPFVEAILTHDRSVITDACMTALVRAETKEEFDFYKKVYPGGNMFAQLDDFIKNSKKKK